MLERLLLLGGHLRQMVFLDVVISRQKEAAGTAGRIADGFARLRLHALDHGTDQRARGEILAGAGLGVLRVALQQAFVQVALDLGIQHHPGLGVDHLDQPRQLGRVLNLVLRLGEDLAQHALFLTQLAQQLDVMAFQLRTFARLEALPVVLLGDAGVPVPRRTAVFVRHLEKDQVCELFQVIAVAHTVVAEHVAEVPDLIDEVFGIHGVRSLSVWLPGLLHIHRRQIE